MYNGLIIKRLLEERNLKNADLLRYLKYPSHGGTTSLNQIMEGNPTVKRLEPVADFFQVSMDIFFNRAVPIVNLSNNSIIGNSNAIGNENQIIVGMEQEYRSKIDSLEKLLIEKDKRIEALEQLVEVLKTR